MSYFAINDVKLDGEELPEIAHKGATFSIEDVDSASTGRNDSGDMIRDRVAVKIKWQLSFPAMGQAMMSKLLDAISDPEFIFTFPDPRKVSGTTDAVCYVGSRSMPVYSCVDGEILFENVSFSVIEL